jgi:hypothetical protein
MFNFFLHPFCFLNPILRKKKRGHRLKGRLLIWALMMTYKIFPLYKNGDTNQDQGAMFGDEVMSYNNDEAPSK